MTARIMDAFADGAAFIPYLAAGDPGSEAPAAGPEEAMAATQAYVEALVAGGADIIELGLPFSEPIADGPTIQQATVRALEHGMTPGRYIELIDRIDLDVPVVTMSYYNPIYQFGDTPGVDAFVEAAAAAGIDGIIVPDLPVEESEPLFEACERQELALIFIAAPTTRDDRLERIMELVSGYLYVQARLGTTGARGDLSDQTRAGLERIRRFERNTARDPIPKAVGFGIASGEHAADVIAAGADGVIVGSALVEIVADSGREAAVRELEERARELKSGARSGIDRRSTRPER